jgi:hypothetical protein
MLMPRRQRDVRAAEQDFVARAVEADGGRHAVAHHFQHAAVAVQPQVADQEGREVFCRV